MSRVVVYIRDYCAYCTAAKRLLEKRGIDYEQIDLTGDRAALAQLVRKAEGRRTVPQIFIDDRPIGGYTELAALDRSGDLQRMLSD